MGIVATSSAQHLSEQPTALDAGEYECQTFTGGACELVYSLGTPVHVKKGNTMAGLDSAIKELTEVLKNFATPKCLEAQVRLICTQSMPLCSTIDSVAVQHLPCRDLCQASFEECDTYVDILRAAGFGETLPTCGGGAYYSGSGADSEPSKFGVATQEVYLEYPKYLEGVECFPQHLTDVTISGRTHEVECVSLSQATSGDFKLSEPDCSNGFVRYEEQCSPVCPHPVYSLEEYQQMFDAYMASAVLYNVTVAILCFLWGFASFVQKKQRRQKKTRVGPGSKSLPQRAKENGPSQYLKRVVIMSCILYGLIGPLFAILGNDRDTMSLACNGKPAIPFAFDSDGGMTTELTSGYMSIACEMNRASIFILMIGFNGLALHLLYVFEVLKHTNNGKSSEKVFTSKAARVGKILIVLVPLVLIGTMYSIDGLDTILEDSAVGHMARWTVICGPRLRIAEEICLVHAPLILTGIAISVLCILIALQIRAAIKGSGSLPGGAKKESVGNSLVTLGKKIVALGCICFALVITFIYLTAHSVPMITALNRVHLEKVVCSWGIIGSIDCSKVTADSVGHEGRPEPLTLIALLLCQMLVPFCLIIFYGTLEFSYLKRHRETWRSSTSSESEVQTFKSHQESN